MTTGAAGESGMSHLSPRKLLNFIDKKHRKLTRKPTYLGNPG
jgi:hypothetical protein